MAITMQGISASAGSRFSYMAASDREHIFHPFAQRLAEMAATQRDIALVAADLGLRARPRPRRRRSTRKFIVALRPQWHTPFSSTSASAIPSSTAEPETDRPGNRSCRP